MPTMLAPVGEAKHARLRAGQRVLLVMLLSCAVVAPFLQLRQVLHLIPARWSDLYPQWTAVKAALHGRDPYSAEVTEEIERGFYGRVLAPHVSLDQQNFVYPAHLIFLLGPFTILPWPAVRFLFTIMAFPVLAATVWAWLEVCGLKLDRTRRMILLVLILTSWPAVWGYQQTQPTIYVVGLIAFSVWLFRRKSDLWAGILLSLATVKPNLVVLVAAWLLFLAIAHRRWRFLAAFGVSTSILVVGAEAFVPGWISRWIQTTSAYAHDPRKVSLLIHLLGRYAGFAATLVLAAALCFWLYKLRAVPAHTPEFGQAIGLLLAATACLIPTTPWMVYNELLLIPGIFALIGIRPSSGIAQMLRGFAILLICGVLLVTPFCVAVGAWLGPAAYWALLPFIIDSPLPVVVTAALLCSSLIRPSPS